MFEGAFEHPGLNQGLNLHLGSALTPCAALPVRVYSDARNVLLGIIDSLDLRKLQDDFLKALVWLLLRNSVQRHKTFTGDTEEGTGEKGSKSQPSHLGQSTVTQPAEAVMVESVSSLKFRRDSSSLTSFGDWSDEDDLFGPQPARRTVALVSTEAQLGHAVLQTGPSLPGSVEMDSLFENMALSALQPLQPLGLGLGLPAVDKGRNPEVPPTKSSGTLAHENFSCPHSELFSLPLGWRTAPLLPFRLQQLRPLFPEDWFRFTLGRLALAVQDEASEDVAKALKEDGGLRDLHAQVALSCLISLGAESAFTSPSYVYRVYSGDVPWTEGLKWLSENKELYQLALKAFR